MATFDATSSSGAGRVAYQPASPYESRGNQVNFATYPLAVADVLKVIPLAAYEFVAFAVMRTDVVCTATSTAALTDTRTGAVGAGVILAATAPSVTAGTTVSCSGAGLNFVPTGAGGGGAGFLTLTCGTLAFAAGTVSIQCVIGKAF